MIQSGIGYDRVLPILLDPALGFDSSPEFKELAGTAEDLPGVVSAAYARYVMRRLDDEASTPLAAALVAPLNEFAAWKDGRVKEMLESEVLWQFAGYMKAPTAKLIEASMNSDLRRLFDGLDG